MKLQFKSVNIHLVFNLTQIATKILLDNFHRRACTEPALSHLFPHSSVLSTVNDLSVYIYLLSLITLVQSSLSPGEHLPAHTARCSGLSHLFSNFLYNILKANLSTAHTHTHTIILSSL